MELLTVKDVAHLKGCSKQYVQSLVKQGSLKHTIGQAANGRPQYLIPVSALDSALQRKWFKQTGSAPPELRLVTNQAPEKPKPLEAYTTQQREQIGYWIELISRWQAFRAAYSGPKNEADEAFLSSEQLDISIKTLYRRWAAYKSDDMDGLIERRGQWKKGQSSIHPDVWKVFLSYYLDQAYDPVAKCIRSTKAYLRIKAPYLLEDFPGQKAFYTRVENDIPAPVDTYYRKGPKALHDRYAPYIRRVYDNMLSNDYWVADNHTFDFMSIGPNGRPHRLYLTAIIDARSTAIMGWQVTHAPCGDATLSALRKAIKPPGNRPLNGIPRNFYVDNGSEFLVHDIGGRGHRKRKSAQEEFEPPGILARLGINMVNAIPGNPEAKIIERIFRDIKDEFSRAVISFCGGSTTERPERLSRLLKTEQLPTDQEIYQAFDEWAEGYFNHLPYGGPVVRDRGKTKIQVYYENREHIRLPATEEDLNLMMMRSSRPVKVGKRGVKLTIAGYTIDYWSDDFLLEWQGKQVYFRYDPEDLSCVRAYDPEDRFICVLPADDIAVMEYGASKEEIKAGMQKINKYNRAVKQWTDGKVLDKDQKISVFTLMQIRAKENINNPPDYPKTEPKIIELVRVDEDTYVFTGKKADEITAQIFTDYRKGYQVNEGELANTGYVIPSLVEDNQTLFDIILKALDLTLINTGKMFYLWDDYGRIRISDVENSRLELVVGDGSLATGYTYASDIDSQSYNKIKLSQDNKTTGRRDVYIFQDSNNMKFWGILQNYEIVNEAMNEAQIKARGDNMLELYNRPSRSFDLTGLSDLSIRAGRGLFITVKEIGVSGYFIVDECSHDLINKTMNLKLKVV